MEQALRQRVVIQPGGKIELQSPDLPAGLEAEVIVLVPPQQRRTRSLTDFIGAAKGTYASPEEADAFIRAERNAWER